MSGLSKKRTGNGKAIYLSIVGGKMKQKVTAETEGALKRTYEVTDAQGVKTEGSKWEIEHQDIFGLLEEVLFKDGDYGEQIIIKIYNAEDDMSAVITTASAGRYGTDFMKKIKNIDLDSEITFNSYDFEDKNGKKRTGVSIVQDGVKIQSFYYDFKTKKSINGLPPVDEKMKESLGKDYWKIFFITEKSFLKNETEEYVKGIKPIVKDEEEKDTAPDTVEGIEEGDLPF